MLGMPGESVSAVAVGCPVCGRADAVAHIVFGHDEHTGTSLPALIAVECPNQCRADVTDPDVLGQIGLADGVG